MSKLDWYNAGDHVWPCVFSLPGDYPVSKIHCSCDLPDRMLWQYLNSILNAKELRPATTERNRRRKIYNDLIEKALDE